MTAPLFYGAGADVFILCGQSGGYAEVGLGTAGFQYVGHHPGVAVRSFYEELGLVLGVGSLLQFLQGFDALIGLYGQVAVEGEALAVESGAHYCQDYA